jgi:hypothetical protein
MFVVHPLTVYWLLHGYYKISAPGWTAYLNYLRTFRWVGSTGPMWFAVALLIFSLVYALVRALAPAAHSLEPATNDAVSALPSNAQVLALILVMGTCTFLVRTVQPMGANILNMQLCFFSQYILLFAVGLAARRHNWLLRLPYDFGIRWGRWTLIVGTLAWIALIGVVFATKSMHLIDGGWNWVSAGVCYWESFFCVGICLGLTAWFRERFNTRGRFAVWMSDNAFAVYLFHTPVLVAVTLGMQGFLAPKLVKFCTAWLLAVTLTFLASHFVFRRIPLLKRVL